MSLENVTDCTDLLIQVSPEFVPYLRMPSIPKQDSPWIKTQSGLRKVSYEIVGMRIENKEPTIDEVKELSARLSEYAILGFVGALAMAIETDGKNLLVSYPVVLVGSQDVPSVEYRGEREDIKPQYATVFSAGFDIQATEYFLLPAGAKHLVSTGLFLNRDHWNGTLGDIRLEPKSGLANKYEITVLGGVVDFDYPGEIKVILKNLGDQDVVFQAGDAVAQGVYRKIDRDPKIAVKDDIRVGGFGSTTQN